MEKSLVLNDKFCKAFGRTLIMAPEADSQELTSSLHLAAMQVIPVLYNSPGSSIEIEEAGNLYKVTNHGSGVYIVKLRGEPLIKPKVA